MIGVGRGRGVHQCGRIRTSQILNTFNAVPMCLLEMSLWKLI